MNEDISKIKLVEYCKKNLRKGYSSQTLKYALINQGYSIMIVENAIEKAHKDLAEKAPVLKEKPKITYELYDIDNKPILLKKPLWKRILGL